MMQSLLNLRNGMRLSSFLARTSFAAQHSSSAVRTPPEMKAWHIHKYGENKEFKLETTSTPTLNMPDQLLVKVYASSINPIDLRIRGGYGRSILNPSNTFPIILGRDLSGVVVETGRSVSDLRPGDKVYGAIAPFSKYQGSFSEYVLVNRGDVTKKPENLTYLESASIPYVALTTWSALVKYARMKPDRVGGQRVLILGSSGGVGTFALQLCKAWGAVVTATCSTSALDLVSQLGADEVLDYTSHDVESALKARGESGRFDFILDTTGNYSETSFAQALLKPCGAYVTLVSPILESMDQHGVPFGAAYVGAPFFMNFFRFLSQGRIHSWAFVEPSRQALQSVAELVGQGQVRPVVERVCQFGQLVEACEDYESRSARGKTAIQITEDATSK